MPQVSLSTTDHERRRDMVPIDFEGQSVRSRLAMALPRLRRFAGILAGDEESRDVLLRNSVEAMLERSHEYPVGSPFDRWAFCQIHAHWLAGLRAHEAPMAQVRADEDIYCPDLLRDDADYKDAREVGAFLASLPPQQRSVVLLIFGEKFSYDDAAQVLDASVDIVVKRAVRGLASLVDRLALHAPRTQAEASVERLYPAETHPNT